MKLFPALAPAALACGQFALAALLTCRAGLAAPLQEGEPPLAPLQGVTILESRDLAAQFLDIERFLAEGNAVAAAGALQQILNADPASLVRVGQDRLFFGAVHEARKMLAGLPPEVLAARESLVGERAAELLEAALNPPDPAALRHVAENYAGTAAAHRAEAALREVLFDRGYPQRAAAGQAMEELLPPKWIEAMPAPRASSPLLMPFVDSYDDPRLPLVRSSGAHHRWSYRFSDSPTPPGYTMHRMAVSGGRGYLTDSREVVALDLASGEPQWRFPGPPEWNQVSPTRFNEMVEGFSRDTILAPVVSEGVVLAPIQEPLRLGRSQDFSRIAVRRFLPGRRLYAFDADTGKILWKQEVEWLRGNHHEPRGLLAAPPAVAAGRVFVPVYDAVGTLDVHMLAFDLHTGELLWDTFLVSGQRETNLFGNVLTELACGPPAADARQVLVCTNLGAICALDAATGAVIWTRLYDRTSVLTSQTGEVARRDETFANGPPAYDGRRFLCAPTDSAYGIALDAETGGLYALWRAAGRNSEYGEMRCLVAATPDGAIFNGMRLAFLPFRGRSGMRWRSKPLVTFHIPDATHSAVLARDEILVPSAEGVLRFDPRTGRAAGTSITWSTGRSGALQAAPGMLLVMNQGGVTAYASPDALLETLLQIGAEPELIAQTLPFLEGLRIDKDPGKAAAVAQAAEKLGERASNREQTESLRLVAGRAWLDARRPEEAGRVAGTLLGSSNRVRRVNAALLVLDALERSNPGSPVLGKALAVLERLAPERVYRHLEGAQPTRHAIARARYFAAQAAGDPDAQRETLLELVGLPEEESILEDGRPLPVWAGRELRRLVAEFPGQAAVFEREAARAFSRGAVTLETVRAFAGTRAASRWLLEQRSRADLTREETVVLSSWLRDYLPPEDRERPISAREIFGAPELPVLPRNLVPLLEVPLGRFRLLDVGAAPQGAYLLMERQGELTLYHATADGLREISVFDPEPDAGPRFLRGGYYFSAAGATVVTRDLWVRLGVDGSRELFRLPGRVLQQYRLGRMAAVLCEGEGRTRRLQVRDLDTGALFFDVRLGAAEAGVPGLVGNGATLVVLESGNRTGLVFRPLESREPEEFELPWTPMPREVDTAVPCGDGVLIPSLRSGEQAFFLVRRNETLILRQPPDAALKPFSAPDGAGWYLDPTQPSSGPFPWPVVGWLGARSDQPLQRELNSYQRARALQLGRSGQSSLPDRMLLLSSRGAGGRTRFEALDLAPGPGRPPETAWFTELDEVPYNQLNQRLQLRPVRGANGWLVTLRLPRFDGQDSRLYSLLLDDRGQVLGRHHCPPPRSQDEARAFAAGGAVVVRSGPTLYLLGDA